MASQQKFRLVIPPGTTAEEREKIAADIITFIQTKAINDHKGYSRKTGRYRRFPAYTKEYAKKKRTSVSNVDLVLTAEMFNEMKKLRDDSKSITIGFEAGTDVNAKAEGNQIGSYGKPRGDPRKARPFLGITKKDASEIIRNVKAE